MTDLITQHLDLWASAIKRKSSAGRGSSSKVELYGIKKLRELILELAVRGLLVPQDPNDEPASELLKKIAAEKARLFKEGKIKKEKALPAITEEEKPFEIPQGWLWVRLSSLCELENGDRSKNYPNKSLLVDSGIPFVNAGHLQDGRVNTAEMTFISEERFNLLSGGKFSDGDILFCLRGSLGKSAIVEGLPCGAIASSLVIVRLIGELDRLYFHNFFDSPLSYKQIQKYDNGTAQPNLSAADLAKFIIPVPPLPEQHRIVAKVDELMALCDQLEQQSDASLAAHQTLVATLLNALTSAAARPEPVEGQSQTPVRPEPVEGGTALVRQAHHSAQTAFDEAWQRIAEHFDTLFTTEESIDQLKQTILQLAVMGKLVPQDPNDEPASELLKKIAAEKARLVKEGKIKKEKPLPPIAEEKMPFALPEGWEWSRIGIIASSTDYGLSEKTFEIATGIPVLKMGDIQDGKVILGGQKRLAQSVNDLPYLFLKSGDLLYNRTNSAELVGKTGIYQGPDNEYTFASYLIRIRCIDNMFSSHYLNVAMNSPIFRETEIVPYLIQQCGQANVNGSIMKNMRFSTPPLAEQHRIVAKVDKLMALCDQLKAGLSAAQTTQLQLADAMTEQALA
ncbi:MAG: restriction endonuclease subunit S [Gammaproteobacteria bacterium]|nr:restriction endonuclease subunit S [Gammaproteobacteria bacterium]